MTSAMSRRFRYRAATPAGRVVRGVVSARDEAGALAALAEERLEPLELSAAQASPSRPIRTHDLAIVFRNVATLLDNGVPIERALAASEPLVPERVAEALDEVRRQLREGSSVADAFASVGHRVPRSIIGVLAAGESGSRLAAACETIASQLERETELRSQVRSALAYPLLILVVGVATIAVMGGVVVPRFALILGEMGAELPASTRFLLWLSETGTRWGLPLTVAALLTVTLGHASLREPSVRRRADRVLLATPMIGRLRMGFASASTCRALGGMLGQGMPLLAALDSITEASGDLEIGARLAAVRSDVAQGAPLTRALEDAAAVAPVALQLIGVGESTGELGAMITRAGDVTAVQTERRLRALVALLEPLLVITLGAVIALTAAALLQAVYSVRPV